MNELAFWILLTDWLLVCDNAHTVDFRIVFR